MNSRHPRHHLFLGLLAFLLTLPLPTLAQEKNAVKFTFLGWITGSTKVSYERAFGCDVPQSGELAVGLIGAGFDKFQNRPRGVTARYGHKFFVGERAADSPLCGWFVRPELILTRFDYSPKDNANSGASASGTSGAAAGGSGGAAQGGSGGAVASGSNGAAGGSSRSRSEMGALLGTAGYQYAHNHFVADFWAGAGYCLGSPADTGYQHGFKVWNYLGSYRPHLALSFSIRLGYCF